MISSEFWALVSEVWKKKLIIKDIKVTSNVDGGGSNMDEYFEDDDAYFDSFDID